MMPQAFPERLSTTSELAPLLRPAIEREVSEARLDANWRAIQATIGGLATAGAIAGASSLGAKSAAAVKAAAAVKLGVAMAVGVGAGVAAYRVVEPRLHHTPAPVAAPAVVPVAPPAAEPQSPAVVAPPVEQPAAPRARREPTAKERASAVAAQLQLYRAALDDAHAGRHDEALRKLTELERKWPHGALEAETVMTRAEILFLAGRDKEAAKYVETHLDSPMVASRKAELWLMLGEIRTRQGACTDASSAYQRALGLGLGDKDAETARRGLRRCAP